MLAGAAIYNKDLDTAAIAYAALNEVIEIFLNYQYEYLIILNTKVDKVEYIQQIKEAPNKEIKNAETALLCGNVQEAELIYTQANMQFRAIMLNLQQYNWER